MTQDRKADTAAHWKSLVRDLRQRNWKSPIGLSNSVNGYGSKLKNAGGKTTQRLFLGLSKTANYATLTAW